MFPLVKTALLVGLAAFATANNDCDSNNGSIVGSCSTASGVVVVTKTTSSGPGGIVITDVSTTSNVILQTSLQPVYTPVTYTSVMTGLDSSMTTITRTSNVLVSATNTQYGSTTVYGLQSGFAYTTDSAGHSTYVYTGTGTPSVTPTPSVVAAGSAGTSASKSSSGMAAVTAAPYVGAALLAGGFAFAL